MPDTPTPEQGQVDQESTFDFKRGYEQLRPEYTRTTQELASIREGLSEYEQLFAALQDPESQAQALAALGIEVGGPPATADPDEFVDPLEKTVDELREEVTQLRSARELEAEAQEEAQTIQLRDEYIGEALDYIEGQTKRKFSERAEEVLGNLAIAMADDDGVPDVQGAYKALYGDEGLLEIERSQWIDSKLGAQPAPTGTSIPADQKPTNRRERVAYIDERFRALEQQQ